MAAQQVLPNSAYVKCELDLTSANYNTTTPTYTDVTNDVRFADKVTWDRGRDLIWDAPTAGGFDWTLGNRSFAYDPRNARPIIGRRPARITCYYPTTATPYIQFVGLAETFETNYPFSGKDAIVKVQGTDWLTTLYLAKMGSGLGLQTTSQAVLANMASAAGIPTSLQSFTPGTYNLLQQSFVGTDLASAMQLVTNSQVQMLFVSKTAVVTAVRASGVGGTSVATFGDGGGAELPYSDLKATVGAQPGAYTSVTLKPSVTTSEGSGVVFGPPVSADTSALAKAQFGPIVLSLPCAGITSYTGAAGGWASLVGTPDEYWLRELTIKPMAAPATLFPVVLGAELGQRYTIIIRPLGVIDKVTFNAVLWGIRHEVGGGDWIVTWKMSPPVSGGSVTGG